MKYDLTCIDCINVVINLKSKTECQLGIGCMGIEREKKGRGEERRERRGEKGEWFGVLATSVRR